MRRSLAVAIGLALCAAPAVAFEPDAESAPGSVLLLLPASHVPDWARPMDSDAEEKEPSWLNELYRELKAIPLRPVAIGDSPRRPTDPEQGAGIVLKLRW